MQVDQQRTPTMTPAQAIQMNQIQNPIQSIDIKTEHQTQQKQTIQVVRPPNVNQPYIAQSLPPNNVNVNVNVNAGMNNANMDQMTAGPAVDDGAANADTSSQSHNARTCERMRQDEGTILSPPSLCSEIPHRVFLNNLLNDFLLPFSKTPQCWRVWQPYHPFCMQIQIILN